MKKRLIFCIVLLILVQTVFAQDNSKYDLNGDGKITFADVKIIAQNFLKATFDPRTDVNNDGSVNLFDLVLSARHMGQTVEAPVGDNLISNPSFETREGSGFPTGWRSYSDGAGTLNTGSPGSTGSYAGTYTISTLGENVQVWQHDIALEAYTAYELSFDAYSNSGHDLIVHLLQHVPPYANYGLRSDVQNLGTSWQNFQINFSTNDLNGFSSVTDGRLRFWLADYDADGDVYWFDNVVLRKADGSPPPPEHWCGDTHCNGDETCTSCPEDCEPCPVEPYCGDDNCDEPDETCENCVPDCNTCPPSELVCTHYVSPSGDDGRSGTSLSSAWRTIAKANSALYAGDTVCIRGGTYNEVIDPSRSGTSGNYITYAQYPNEEAIIRGNSNQGYLAKLSGESYVAIEGLTFIHGFRVKTYRGGWISVESANSKHNIVRNNIITTSAADQAASMDEKNKYNDKGIVIAYSQDTLIEGNYIKGMEQGIHPKRHPYRTIIRNNVVTETWQSAIVIGSPGAPEYQSILIEGNILEKSIIEDGIQFAPNYDLTGPAHEADISNLGTVIRNNIIRYNAENAIDFKGAGNIVVEGNIIYGTEGDNDGPFRCSTWDTCEGGNERGSFRTIMHGSRTKSRDMIIRNNVLYDNAPGINLLDKGYRAYHNTVIGNNRDYTGPNSAWNPSGSDTRVFAGIFSRSSNNAVIKNNIMAGHKHGEISLKINSQGGLDINNNLYWNDGGTNFIEQLTSGFDVIGFSSWKSKLQSQSNVYGNDAASIVQKPVFVNVPSNLKPVGDHSSFDFRLASGSAGINDGGALTWTTSSGSGTQIYVDDAGYFFDGFDITDGDSIVVGSNSPVRITAIDYGSNRLTVERSISWNNNDPVNLPYSGSAPDIGAFEYGMS